MKKALVVFAVLIVGGWYVLSRSGARPAPAAPAPAPNTGSTPTHGSSSVATPTPKQTTPVSAPTPGAAILPAAVTRPTATRPPPAARTAQEQMPFNQMLQANNRFEDPQLGVGVTLPDGWAIRDAFRWGQDHRENTVFFSPPPDSAAIPSMYYQRYPDGPPAAGNAEAMLREMAASKEASRRSGASDYTNDPGSFVFREINGQPTLSYFATYSRGDEVQAEYFMRILGPQGYVMFFIRGPVRDVQAIIPPVFQMGGTVKAP